jgi:hypothetical protein
MTSFVPTFDQILMNPAVEVSLDFANMNDWIKIGAIYVDSAYCNNWHLVHL